MTSVNALQVVCFNIIDDKLVLSTVYEDGQIQIILKGGGVTFSGGNTLQNGTTCEIIKSFQPMKVCTPLPFL